MLALAKKNKSWAKAPHVYSFIPAPKVAVNIIFAYSNYHNSDTIKMVNPE